MLPVATAAAVTGFTPRMLYRWVEQETLHFIESTDGTVLLCAESFKTLPETLTWTNPKVS
jgi:hypothetical protein